MIFKKLANGLDIFTLEDHRSPVFSFVLLFGVGSMDEFPGITGASHIIEHMLFKGSEKVNGVELNKFIRRHGGYLNAETHEDRTLYYVTLPITEIEYPLEIWSDLMINANFDEKEFIPEMDVIREERRLRSEDDPIGALFEALNASSFWAHPYRWPVIGWMIDLQNITRDKIYSYYKSFYRPDNAVIVMKGDFDENMAMDLVEKHFGVIPINDSPIIRPRSVEPLQTGMRRSQIRKPAELPVVMIGFHAPDIDDESVYPLLVAEKVLSSGESSRIFRNIILEKRLAVGAGGVFDYLKRDPGLFIFFAQAAPDKTSGELETALWSEVDSLIQSDISIEEIEKAKNIVEAQLIYRMERNLAESIIRGEFHLVSSIDRYDSFVENIRNVNRDMVRDVCSRILIRDNSTVAELIPQKNSGGASLSAPCSEISKYMKCNYRNDDFPSISIPKPDGLPFWKDSERFELGNSMKVIAYHRNDLPIVQIGMLIRAGACFDAPEKAGLASLCGNLVKAGTHSRSSSDISDEVESLGGQFGLSVQRETFSVGMQFLSRYYKIGLDVLSDCVIYPSFDDNEVNRYKELQSGDVKAIEDDVWQLTPREFVRNLFQTPSYSNPLLGTLESVDSLSREDVLDFHKTNFSAENCILSIVGDFDKTTIRDDLERFFGKAESAKKCEIPENNPKTIESPVIVKLHKDVSQSSIVLGNNLFSRKSDDYYAYLLMNVILGGDALTSRLGDSIREKSGLSYFIQSGFIPNTKTGFWQIMLQTRNENAGRALELIRREMKQIREVYVTDEELNDAKSSLRGRSALEIETNRGLIMKLLSIAYYDIGDDYMENVFKKIDNVTREQVIDVAKKYLDPEKYLMMIVGDTNKMII